MEWEECLVSLGNRADRSEEVYSRSSALTETRMSVRCDSERSEGVGRRGWVRRKYVWGLKGMGWNEESIAGLK